MVGRPRGEVVKVRTVDRIKVRITGGKSPASRTHPHTHARPAIDTARLTLHMSALGKGSRADAGIVGAIDPRACGRPGIAAVRIRRITDAAAVAGFGSIDDAIAAVRRTLRMLAGGTFQFDQHRAPVVSGIHINIRRIIAPGECFLGHTHNGAIGDCGSGERDRELPGFAGADIEPRAEDIAAVLLASATAAAKCPPRGDRRPDDCAGNRGVPLVPYREIEREGVVAFDGAWNGNDGGDQIHTGDGSRTVRGAARSRFAGIAHAIAAVPDRGSERNVRGQSLPHDDGTGRDRDA